jgi:N-acetylmuramic acid 6-phosphate etherase
MQGVRPKSLGPSLDQLDTEQVNPRTVGLDRLPTLAMIRRLQREDAAVAPAVARTVVPIARAVEAMAERFKRGGRIVYIGAGTSGRLGVLDASECPPTFGIAPGRIVGVIAGGKPALTRSSEGVEDSPTAGRHDLAKLRLKPDDCVIGIAASGRTPYTVAALNWAGRQGCLTVAIACSRNSPLARAAEIAIEPLTGAESIAGSTRLKAGTAQKMVLNLLSTGVMVRVGRTRGNLMAHVQSTNVKLRRRAARIRQAGEL